MGERKKNVKNFGVSDYTWSSDDDEPAIDLSERADPEPRPSVADQPGTSGLQPQLDPAAQNSRRTLDAAGREQARVERNMFWQYINNPVRRNVPQFSWPPNAASQVGPSSVAQMARNRSAQLMNQQDEQSDSITLTVPNAERACKMPRSTLAASDISKAYQRPWFCSAGTHRSGPTGGATGQPAGPSAARPAAPSATRPVAPPAARPAASSAARIAAATTVRTAAPSAAKAVPQPGQGGPNRDEFYVDNSYFPDHGFFIRSRIIPDRVYETNQNQAIITRILAHVTKSTAPIPVPEASTQDPRNAPQGSSSRMPLRDPRLKVEPPDEVPDQSTEAVEEAQGSGARLIEEVLEVEPTEEMELDPPPPGTEAEVVQARTSENNNSAEPAPSTSADSPQQASSPKEREAQSGKENDNYYKINQQLLRLLECPVCLDWTDPPIWQCRRGHLVCARCRQKLTNCPVCRTPFSSVRNRAMEGVSELVQFPCKHGCGREMRIRSRASHEASCASRRYSCPAPNCVRNEPLQRNELAQHFQSKHLPILKIGLKHNFSIKVNTEQHNTWLIMTDDEYFHLNVDVDMRSFGLVLFVAYLGPKKYAKCYTYQVTMEGVDNSRKLQAIRATHSDLEVPALKTNRQDCFHLTLEQTNNFVRVKSRHYEPDKYVDFDIEIAGSRPSSENSNNESDAKVD